MSGVLVTVHLVDRLTPVRAIVIALSVVNHVRTLNELLVRRYATRRGLLRVERGSYYGGEAADLIEISPFFSIKMFNKRGRSSRYGEVSY